MRILIVECALAALLMSCAAKKQVATLAEVSRDSTATTKSNLIVEQFGDELIGFVPAFNLNKEAAIKKDTVFYNSAGLKLWFVPSVINGVDGFNFKAEAKPTARSTLQTETETKNTVKEAKQETASNFKQQSFIEQLTEFLKAASWAVGILIIVYIIIKLSGKFKGII
ncbi:hypothetical protein [Pedobacter sp. SL55]|uniref:hypothetical protein n=1 Tax=Pedobacter sp. SL55 TaxID=2995161 RepID=UPI002271496F|nr:hypothetical protein [Pedobacter sp. SL55]WAC40580.1 hypothetical protein OVA16_18745 [Pedobacter sp. SL55]